jgi:hypothetical protein
MHEEISDDILQEMKIHGLSDLYIRAIKEQEQFRTMVNALSYNLDKLDDESARHFKRTLKHRIQTLEDTIDVHLNSINGLERFVEKNYLYKLLVLDANEEKIIMKDSGKLRMVDVI